MRTEETTHQTRGVKAHFVRGAYCISQRTEKCHAITDGWNARSAKYRDYTGIEEKLRGLVKRVRRKSYRTNFIVEESRNEEFDEANRKQEREAGQEQTVGPRISGSHTTIHHYAKIQADRKWIDQAAHDTNQLAEGTNNRAGELYRYLLV